MFFCQSENCKCSGSFIKMPAKEIAEMAKATLVWVEESRAKISKRYIDDARQEMMNGWWHRLTKRPAPTDEEALERIKENPWSGFNIIHLHGGKAEDAARRLLVACKYVDEIYISTEDLQRIS